LAGYSQAIKRGFPFATRMFGKRSAAAKGFTTDSAEIQAPMVILCRFSRWHQSDQTKKALSLYDGVWYQSRNE
jgi:hypothetical protein